MKKKISVIILALLVVALCVGMFTGCAKKNENMLTTNSKGEFTYTDLNDLMQDFSLDYSDEASSASTVFDYSSSETDGNTVGKLVVNTSTGGYATLSQKVRLNAGCYYKATIMVKPTQMSAYVSGQNYDGVYVTVLEDEDFTYDTIDDTSATVVTRSFGFKASKTEEVTFAFCVGNEENPSNAVVELTGLKLERVSKAETDGIFACEVKTDFYGTNTDFNIFYIVMGAFAVLALCVVGYIMYRRSLGIGEYKKGSFGAKLSNNGKLSLGLVIAVGAFIVLLTDILSTAIASAFAHHTMGYNLEGLASQAVFLAKYGPQYLLKSLSGDFATDTGYTIMSVSSSPLQLYFLAFAGLFGRIFEGTNNLYLATMFFIRFFAAATEVASAVLLFKLVSEKVGNVGGIVVAVMYLCLPVVFATSSLWGYLDSVTAFLVFLTFYFILKNNYIATAITYFVACMFSQVALFVAPMILFYTIFVCIKDKKNIIPAACILVLSFFAFYALNVPFDINYIQNGDAFHCFTRAWAELYKNAVYVVNAFNFQAMLGNNNATVTTASLVVTIIFILFMLTLIGLDYFKFKNRMNLILLATAFINMMFVFGNDMKPTSIYLSLILMLAYAVVNREKRVYFSFVVFAILTFINVSYCELMVEYTASSFGLWTENATMYVFSAFELVAVLYYIYIVYDIVVSKKYGIMKPMTQSFGSSVDTFIRKIKKGYYKMRLKNAEK